MAKAATVEFYKNRKREWSWRLTSRNGQVIASPAESFKRPSGARKNFATVMFAFFHNTGAAEGHDGAALPLVWAGQTKGSK